ncbi:MAG: hypothetical protein FJ297_07435 [Planctomycetes bacterium]|nr:hypothetical protein [Planctomycetota bacterium]
MLAIQGVRMSSRTIVAAKRFALFLAAGPLLAAGCGSDSTMSPPKLRPGEETCAHCLMIISEGRFAAALAARDGRVAKFDDTGCLLEYLPTLPEPAERVWIGNSVNGEWIDAESAWIVRSDAIATPMASGLAAFATREEAERKAKELKTDVRRSDAPSRRRHGTLAAGG